MSEPDTANEAPVAADLDDGGHPETHHQKPGEAGDVASALAGLVDIQDHGDIERDVSAQVKAAAVEEENKKDEGRIANLHTKIRKLEEQRTSLITQKDQKEKARAPRSQVSALATKISSCADNIADLFDEIAAFEERIEERKEQHAAAPQAPQTDGAESHAAGPTQQEGEGRQAFLIRTGKITPFAGLGDPEGSEDDSAVRPRVVIAGEPAGSHIQTSHQVLRQPGFATTQVREPIGDDSTEDLIPTNLETEFGLRPRKRQRTSEAQADEEAESDDAGPSRPRQKRRTRSPDGDADFAAEDVGSGVSDVEESEALSSAEDQAKTTIKLSTIDDANKSTYDARLSTWVRERRELRESLGEGHQDDDVEEWFKPTPGKPNRTIYEDYSLPEEVFDFLFPFQRVGIKWLAQLHRRREGGILCDEMGLGKTVQIISFLAALHFSKKLDGPVLIIAPATLISQWVKHFHTWWPPLRVSILHSTGSGMMNPQLEDAVTYSAASKKSASAQKIINNVLRDGHVLVTTYRGLHTYMDELAPIEWGYAVLDEGHQIRNRATDASRACKQLNTWHRIILSGTPVQNNLRELFSLFEFVYPGLLGADLRDFSEHFESPIRDGHHRGASSLAIATGDRCSNTLRETVKPYMLRRIKADVADSLPSKTEQVFFCKLTLQQERIYEAALDAPEVRRVFDKSGGRSADVFSAIDKLRKICNHPDLRYKNRTEIADWGNPDRSVKVQVLAELLRVSKRFGHKTLVFSQILDVLTIVERFLRSENISFVRMDGRTPQVERQPLVDRFNHSADIDVFLLTPQTGGVGLNLTGADRVILFDPSWNPATDRQAIERAWRLGQTKPVKIYRLLTPGTIEEKMYRKQLYKQFVSDRVMSDTEFSRYVDTSNLFDLFTYGSGSSPGTKLFDDTSAIYENTASARTRDGQRQRPPRRQDPTAEESAETERKALDAVNRVEAVEEYADEGADEKDMLDAVFNNNAEVVYEHESVLNSKHRVRADKKLTEQEADRLNERTVRFLREQANQAYFARHGGPGGQAAKPPGGGGAGSSSHSRQWNLGSTKRIIAGFLKKKGGRKADSATIVRHFNQEYSDVPKDLFMKALSSVTTKEDGPRGGTIWRLKANL